MDSYPRELGVRIGNIVPITTGVVLFFLLFSHRLSKHSIALGYGGKGIVLTDANLFSAL